MSLERVFHLYSCSQTVNHIEEAITKFPCIISLLYQHFLNFPLTHFLLGGATLPTFIQTHLWSIVWIQRLWASKRLSLTRLFQFFTAIGTSGKPGRRILPQRYSALFFWYFCLNLLNYWFLSSTCAAKRKKWSLPRIFWTHLGQLLQPETPEDFFKEWEFFQSEYADQKV